MTRPTIGGYPSSDRPASDLAPPPRGPAPGARKQQDEQPGENRHRFVQPCDCGETHTLDQAIEAVRRDATEKGPPCERCNLDRHRCPGCGAVVPHGQVACDGCSAPGIENLVECEGCPTLLDDETCKHDIEGCPLCDDCWDAMLARNLAARAAAHDRDANGVCVKCGRCSDHYCCPLAPCGQRVFHFGDIDYEFDDHFGKPRLRWRIWGLIHRMTHRHARLTPAQIGSRDGSDV